MDYGVKTAISLMKDDLRRTPSVGELTANAYLSAHRLRCLLKADSGSQKSPALSTPARIMTVALNNKIIRVCAAVLLAVASSTSLELSATAQGGRQSSLSRNVEPNVYAPDLYADKLRMKFTLVNLPGSGEPGSFWEISYRLYFIPEAVFAKEVERRKHGEQNSAGPPQYSRQVLLAQGHFKKAKTATLKDRTYILDGVDFKSKVPDGERTKFAILMTVYSVKIFDARLKTTAYHSSYFVTTPFADDPAQPQKAVPRTTIYTSFYLSPKGNIWGSQLPREGDDINW